MRSKPNFTDRLKYAFTNDDNYFDAWFKGEKSPLSTGSGRRNVTKDVAMKYSAVFGCVRVLSETMACLPIVEYKRDKDGNKEVTRDTEAFEALHGKPNEEMTPFTYKETSMINLNTGGNAVSEILRNSAGQIVGLYPYPWEFVTIDRNKETGMLEYKIRTKNENKTLSRNEVFHIPGMSLNGIVGLSPIAYARHSIELGMSYQEFGNQFYKNGTNAAGAFTVDNELGEEAYNRLKSQVKEHYSGLANTGKPMLLEGGMTFQPFTINPADAQLIENKRFQIEDIARIYRVPLHLIQELSRSTNNNIEQQSLEFVMYTMLPWAKRWEESANCQLLTPEERRAGYFYEVNMTTLLRGSTSDRAAYYAKGRQWGWLSVNDIRRLENMKPVANGDIYLQPSNMIEAGEADQQLQNLYQDIIKMIEGK